MNLVEWPRPSKRDTLRALQACYYVLHVSIVSDTEYDRMEKAYTKATGKKIPVGSDAKDSYTDAEWALALFFAFRKSWEDAGFKASKIPKMRDKQTPQSFKAARERQETFKLRP